MRPPRRKMANGTGRTFGTGEGFTADAIITGFLSADRIEAHSITANKLAADIGQSLDLSSNTSIRLTVENIVETKVESVVGDVIGYRVEIVPSHGAVLSSYVPQTTLAARVWHGSVEVTYMLDASRFVWIRHSHDETADIIWNAAHRGREKHYHQHNGCVLQRDIPM